MQTFKITFFIFIISEARVKAYFNRLQKKGKRNAPNGYLE